MTSGEEDSRVWGGDMGVGIKGGGVWWRAAVEEVEGVNEVFGAG